MHEDERFQTLVRLVERASQLRSPNRPIPGYELPNREQLIEIKKSLSTASPQSLGAIVERISECIELPQITSEEADAEHYALHYELWQVIQTSQILNDEYGTTKLDTQRLDIDPNDYKSQLNDIRSSIKYIELKLEAVDDRIAKSASDGIAIVLGPVSIPLGAVRAAAANADAIASRVTGVDVAALSGQLEAMAESAAEAMETGAKAADSIGRGIQALLKQIAVRAVATAKQGMALLREAADRMGQLADGAVPPTPAQSSFKIVGPDIAVDIGTSETRAISTDSTSIITIPTIVGASRSGRKYKYYVEGDIDYRSPEMELISPVIDGLIVDQKATAFLLKAACRRTGAGRGFVNPRIAASVPSSASKVQEREITRACLSASARRVGIVQTPLAVGLGMGLPVAGPDAWLVIDMGAGKTDVGVITLGGVVYSRHIPCGGNHITDAIRDWAFRRRGITISHSQAENIKCSIGSVDLASAKMNEMINITGGSPSGAALQATITGQDIQDVIFSVFRHIIDNVIMAIEATPPELAFGIHEKGLHVAGGGANIDGLAQVLKNYTGIHVTVADAPEFAVVRGTRLALLSEGSIRRAIGL